MSDAQNQGQTSGGSNNDQSQGVGVGGQQQVQQQQQQQQQLQLQQNNAAQNVQGTQQHQQMQQLQVIQQPQQNQTYLQQFYNAQGQPQLIMQPSNIAFNQLNPQIQPAQLAPSIQVITAGGKTFQPNQLNSPFTTATGYATIPTSAANNQAYIIGQLINSSQPSILQQHQQQNKPGEMQKVIQPQITQAQLPQGLTWAPQFLQNSIFIRGTQPDQQPMFIQQQQPLHNNTGSHQAFTMPLTATGHPTSNGLQISQQQQQQNPQTSQSAQSVTMAVQQNQSQQGNGNVSLTAMKAPGQANLQPKPQPLQIQPSPTNQPNQQQQQALQHQQLQNVNVSMGVGGQFQMIPQNSQPNVISQPFLTQNAQGQITTTQVLPQQGQGQPQQQQRHLTILPQQAGGHQQVTFIQQQPPQQQQQQQQQIRPNYTVTAASPTIQQGGTPTTATAPQQRPKIRKPGVGRGTTNQNQGQNSQSPNQGNKVMYPRPTMPNAVGQGQMQAGKMGQNQGHASPSGATISRVSVANASQQPQQPLKTINISALHTPPSLPDATLTPLIPQSNAQITATLIPPPIQPLQLFTTTQLPTPNISITPAPLQNKQEEGSADNSGQHRETEKENTKMKQSAQSTTEDGEDSKQKLPKAMVKPQAQLLTHVIEGFVMQESDQPFPPVHKNGDCDEPPKKKLILSHMGNNTGGGEMGRCEMCGKVDLKSKFKKNKRFCSSSCAKGMKSQQHKNNGGNSLQINNSKTKNNKKWSEPGDGDLTDETSSSMGDTTCPSPAIQEEPDPKMNPVKWNVVEVVDFVRSLPGCSEYADDFAVQEIDGQALMLLKEDHLMSAIGMKLGPALKLVAKIASLGGGGDQSSSKA